MRNGNIILAVNDSVRVVTARYEPEKATDYHFKTTDLTLRKDDIVVVPTNTRVGYTCVKITDTDVDFDIDSDIELSWVVGKVDLAAFNEVLDREKQVVKTVLGIERNRKRAQLREGLLAGADEQTQALLLGAAPPVIIE